MVVGALLVTSFTTVGLVALWAAVSRWHWFLRCAVLLAILSPLLFVPAYEPFLVYAIQASIIVAGVQFAPGMNRLRSRFPYRLTRQPKPAGQTYFSELRYLRRPLLYATPLAVLIALTVQYLVVPTFPSWFPLFVFALEVAAILAGVQLFAWLKRLRIRRVAAAETAPADHRRSPLRFSLKTLLLATPVIAVVAAIAARISMHIGPQSAESITTILLNGVGSGVAVLLAAWMLESNRKRIVWPAALVLCFGLAAILAWFDWMFQAFIPGLGWPPQSPTAVAILAALQTHPQLAWFIVLPAVMLITLLAVAIWRFGFSRSEKHSGLSSAKPAPWTRVAAGGAIALLFIACASFPLSILWELLHPLPLPIFTVPSPNGLDQIVAAGVAFERSPILSTLVEPKSTAELAAEIAKHASAYDELRLGLSREIRVRDWPREKDELAAWFDVSLNALQSTRSAARGLMREAELTQQQGRYDDAIRSSLDNIRLGLAIPRDGLLTDYLVGIAIEGIGHHSLYQAIANLDADQCRDTIAALSELQARREPLEDVLLRDRIWMQHAFGWSGHLSQIFEEIAPRYNTTAMVRKTLHRTQAVTRLLMAELAIRAFRLERDALPDSLTELTPKFFDQVPVDPFDSAGGPLRYVRTGVSYALYSVSEDGRDDRGHAADRGVWPFYGDLRLEVFLAPWETATATTSVPTVDGDAEKESEPIEIPGDRKK
jgi:hypothetical protein